MVCASADPVAAARLFKSTSWKSILPLAVIAVVTPVIFISSLRVRFSASVVAKITGSSFVPSMVTVMFSVTEPPASSVMTSW